MFALFRPKTAYSEEHLPGDGPFAVAGHEPFSREGKFTHGDEAKTYRTAPSIIDYLPWGEYLNAERCLLLDDGLSVGAVYEVIPVGTEGRPAERLEEIRDVVEDALQDSLPELDSNQWVVQFYCQDETDVTAYMDKLRGYVKPWAQWNKACLRTKLSRAPRGVASSAAPAWWCIVMWKSTAATHCRRR